MEGYCNTYIESGAYPEGGGRWERAPLVSKGAPKRKGGNRRKEKKEKKGKEKEKKKGEGERKSEKRRKKEKNYALPRGRGEGEMAKLEAVAPTRKEVKMAPLPCGAVKNTYKIYN